MRGNPDAEEPTQAEWRDLYEAAAAFKALRCWEWMYDSDLFGVVEPEVGEVGYCSVMGALGQHFALGVFIGTEGLRGYHRIYHEPEPDDPLEPLLHHRCLMASFEDRGALESEDRKIIRSLGLRFRGRSQWPLFRSYRPGYVPWFVDGREARFLTVALRQATEVAPEYRYNHALCGGRLTHLVQVRVPARRKGGLAWRSEMRVVERPKAPLPARGWAPDAALARETLDGSGPPKGAWEVDLFPVLIDVREPGKRPYFPKIAAWVDHASGKVLRLEQVGLERTAYEFGILTLSTMGLLGQPEALLVPSEEVGALLEPLATVLGIELRSEEELPGVAWVRAGMEELARESDASSELEDASPEGC